MPVETRRSWLSRLSARISRSPSGSIHHPTEEERAGFRRAQRLAYDCVLAVEQELQEGWTERQTAQRMDTYLRDHGVNVYLHRPFAWFGDHSRFDGYKRFTDFHPGSRRLEADQPFILDVSPAVDGYIGDIGYSSCLQPNAELDAGMEYLLELRDALPRYFASPMSAAEIWARIDSDAAARGFDNIHARYPFAVLGHRVYRLRLWKLRLPRIPLTFASWFSLQGGLEFTTHKVLPELLTPDHEGEKTGLWAVEPHFGRGKTGFKFEEILVVEQDRAYWLDDDVPHVKKYGRRQAVR